MRKSFPNLIAALFLSMLALAAGVSAQPAPQPSGPVRVNVTSTGVMASNLSPKGSVLVIGMGVTFVDYGMRRHVWREQVSDEDGDGTVSFSPTNGVPDDSIWVVVEIATGRSAARSAGDHRAAVALGQLRRKEGLGRRALADQRLAAFAVVVAKGKGAWWLSGADGGVTDADGRGDGSLELNLADAEALTKETPSAVPADFTADDHVVWLDPDRMEYLVTPVLQISRVVN